METSTSSEKFHHVPPGKIEGRKETHLRILSRNSLEALEAADSELLWIETSLMEADFIEEDKRMRLEEERVKLWRLTEENVIRGWWRWR